MPRKLFKRWMPDATKLKQSKALSFLGHILHDPNLFHLNRHSASAAVFIGLFCAFLPIPGQMLVGALACVVLRANLPIAIALIWISNPFTIGPIFYATYSLGAWLLNAPTTDMQIQLSWSWLSTKLGLIWAPLIVGSLLTGLLAATGGYLAMQSFWRWHVVRNWQKRRVKRDKKCADQPVNRTAELVRVEFDSRAKRDTPKPTRSAQGR
jgi:uncharacterized protein (DUF2062 family)